MKVHFVKCLVAQQRYFEEGQSFIASIANKYALNMKVINDKLTNNIWIGDTGASCHMRTSLNGMYDMEPVSGGIKVGSGKILKIVKVGKFKGNIVQKDGSSEVIILNKVHFVPNMYCNIFSITAAMDEGLSLSGRKDSFLTLQKSETVIKVDQIIKSGAGKLVGIRMTPTSKSTTQLIRKNVIKAHNIFAQAGDTKHV